METYDYIHLKVLEMTEAIFGLLGVIVGSGLAWYQTYWTHNKEKEKTARYLAIRVVCILDKFLEECADVVNDDGLSFGQPNSQGFHQPRVPVPEGPVYPDDVDWKSIDHELMYKILSFPSEVDGSKGIIKSTLEIAAPPDYSEWFEERAFWFSQFGLQAYKLSKELCAKYTIKMKTYNAWNPVEDLTNHFTRIQKERELRITKFEAIVERNLGIK